MNDGAAPRVLVAGGAGFLGSHSAKRLRRDFPESVITVLDREEGQNTDIRVDLTDDRATIDALRDSADYDWVLNFAALSFVPSSFTEPRRYLTNNVLATQNLLDALSTGGFRGKLLHFSSCEVYGDATRPSTRAPLVPKSPYAASKAAQELVLRAHHIASGGAYAATIMRLYNIYGPGQQHNRLLPSVVHAAATGESLALSGDGEQTRTFLHVDDLMDLLVSVVAADATRTAEELRIYNVAGPDVLSVNDVVTLARRDAAIPTVTAPSTSAALRVSVGDPMNVMDDFGWSPSRTVADFVRKSISIVVQSEEVGIDRASGNLWSRSGRVGEAPR